ncbi:hypothetical protein D1007_51809 [Hordeum vulgare]|nr:hypothetical protein D1007_51809 [Hordeum vulgare]
MALEELPRSCSHAGRERCPTRPSARCPSTRLGCLLPCVGRPAPCVEAHQQPPHCVVTLSRPNSPQPLLLGPAARPCKPSYSARATAPEPPRLATPLHRAGLLAIEQIEMRAGGHDEGASILNWTVDLF